MTPEQQAQQLRSLSLFVPIAFGLQGWLAANVWAGATPLTGGPPAVTGGAIGAALGFLLVLANRPFAQRIETQPPTGTTPSGWPAVLMLVVPAVAVGLFWLSWRTDAPLPWRAVDVGYALAVPVTGVLAFFDLRRLIPPTPERPPGIGVRPIAAAGAMAFLWAIVFPAHFFMRAKLGGSKLFAPVAVVVALAYMSPVVARWTRTCPPPHAGSTRVIHVLTNMLTDPAAAIERVEDRGPLDNGTSRRGVASLRTPDGPVEVGIVVACPFGDGTFEVRTEPGP